MSASVYTLVGFTLFVVITMFVVYRIALKKGKMDVENDIMRDEIKKIDKVEVSDALIDKQTVATKQDILTAGDAARILGMPDSAVSADAQVRSPTDPTH